MGTLWEVAPPGTWAAVGVAACLLLLGVVLLSHALLRRRARGDRWHGPLHGGRLETFLRLGVATLAGGLGLWAWELRAAGWILTAAAAAALMGVGLEAAARARSS